MHQPRQLPKTLRLASLALTCLFATSLLSAAEYIVATNGVDDPNRNGSSSQPFASIAYALSRAKSAGDIVTVQAGTYRGGEARFQASGVSGNPITLRGAPGATVILKGSALIPSNSWTYDSGSGSTTTYRTTWNHSYGSYHARYLDDDPNNDGYNNGNVKPRNQFFANGALLEEVGRKDWLKANSFYLDPAAKLVYVRLANGANPSGFTMEGTNQQMPLVASFGRSHLVIRNLRLTHLANNVADAAALRISAPYGGATGGQSSFVTVEDVHVSWVHGSGISVQGPDHIIRNSEFSDNGHNGLHAAAAHRGLFQNIRHHRNNTHPGKQFNVGWEAVMKVAGGTKNAVFDNFHSSYNNGFGFWIDGPGCQGNTLKNSLIHNNANQGVRIEICFTTKIHNNVIRNNGESGIEISAAIGNEIYHNTLVGNGWEGINIGSSRTWANGTKMSSYSNVFHSNIVYDNQRQSQYRKSFFITRNPENVSNNLPTEYGTLPNVPYALNRSNHNVFILTPAHPYYAANRDFFVSGGTTPYLHVYQANTGEDLQSRWVDPLFVNAGAHNYALTAASPARNAGQNGIDAGAFPFTGATVSISGARRLINKSNGHALHRSAAAFEIGSNGHYVITSPVSSGNSNQTWNVSAAGTGFHRFVNANVNRSLQRSTKAYTPNTVGNYSITQTTSTSGDTYEAQRWQVLDLGAGYFRLINKFDGKSLHRADEAYGSSGNYVITFTTDHDNDRQKWQIIQ
jgi:parallel beta-helix repeat protein